MFVVSACLLGCDCKYSGGNNLNEELVEFLKDKKYIIVCPEADGGLPTPRDPSEIVGGSGYDVLDKRARVMSDKGTDVSEFFIRGAELALRACKEEGCKIAILKERSPSCGSNKIYDGSFSGTKIDGRGVCAALLERNGIILASEENFKRITTEHADIMI